MIKHRKKNKEEKVKRAPNSRANKPEKPPKTCKSLTIDNSAHSQFNCVPNGIPIV